MNGLKNNVKARVGMTENVEYVLRDKFGNIKPIFQENSFLRFLLKHGLISPLWINKWYSAFVSPFFGFWAQKRLVSNLVTDAGKAGVASRINGDGSEAAFTYIAVGTGTTAANAADTTLETELAASGLSRAAATVSRVTTDVTNDSARLTKTFSVTGTVAVTESGVLNAASTGVLLARQVFSAVNVVNGDSLAVTWTIDCD